MLPTLRRLVPAALLFAASGALADSSLPPAEVPAKEITTHTAMQPQSKDQELRELTLTVESLRSEVQQLREKEAQRADRQAELLNTPNPWW